MAANASFSPLERDFPSFGKGFNPTMVIVGALTQRFFVDDLHLVNVAEEVDDILGAGEHRADGPR